MQKKALVQIIQGLEKLLQIPLFLVGGAVRDFLLDKPIEDFDFTTPALPEEVEEKIRKIGKKPYLVGKKFGTIGLKYDLTKFLSNQKVQILSSQNWQTQSLENCKTQFCFRQDQIIEITTFRKETYLKNSRKPEVSFSDNIYQDLSRRDFTINAMALDSNAQIIDFFNGQKDLLSKNIKTVGNPQERFTEDPLRILRAIRFAGKLNFLIDLETLESIKKTRFDLFKVSKERWVLELDKILQIPDPQKALNLLMHTQVMQVLLPEISLQKNYQNNLSLWQKTLQKVNSVSFEDLDLRWAAFFSYLANPFEESTDTNLSLLNAEISIKLAKYLKFSNQRTEFIYNKLLNS